MVDHAGVVEIFQMLLILGNFTECVWVWFISVWLCKKW